MDSGERITGASEVAQNAETFEQRVLRQAKETIETANMYDELVSVIKGLPELVEADKEDAETNSTGDSWNKKRYNYLGDKDDKVDFRGMAVLASGDALSVNISTEGEDVTPKSKATPSFYNSTPLSEHRKVEQVSVSYNPREGRDDVSLIVRRWETARKRPLSGGTTDITTGADFIYRDQEVDRKDWAKLSPEERRQKELTAARGFMDKLRGLQNPAPPAPK